MPRLKKVLCPVDLSEEYLPLISYSHMIAEVSKCELMLVYVVSGLKEYSWLRIPHHAIDKTVEDIASAAKVSIDDFIKKYYHDVDAHGIIAIGDPAHEVFKIAEKENVDLIVMGTHCRRGMNKFLFGSVAEKLIKTAPCPVLTVSPECALED